MKRYEIKIAVKSGENTFWRTIGTVFCGDDARMTGAKSGKPTSFVIDYPPASGIIVKAESKEDKEKRLVKTAEPETQPEETPAEEQPDIPF